MPVPTRLGLVTGHYLANKLKTLLQKYQEEQEQYLTPTEYEKVLELIQCLINFLSGVPKYPTE